MDNAVRMGNFNSIKVRLEQEFSPHSDLFDPFQFHKGTIRTMISCIHVPSHIHFNSIKVRLELRLIIGDCFLLFYFNSIKVRLEHSISLFKNLIYVISIP